MEVKIHTADDVLSDAMELDVGMWGIMTIGLGERWKQPGHKLKAKLKENIWFPTGVLKEAMCAHWLVFYIKLR